MNMAGFWQAMLIIVIIIPFVLLMTGFYQLQKYNKRNFRSRQPFDFFMMIQLIYYMLTALNPLLFLLLFSGSLFWFFFYKSQSSLFIVLPDESVLLAFQYSLIFLLVSFVSIILVSHLVN